MDSGSLFRGKFNPLEGVSRGRDYGVGQVFEVQDDRGRVDTRVASKYGIVFKIFVKEKIHFPVRVVDESHGSDASGRDTEIPHHQFLTGKRETSRIDLSRKIFCLENFFTGHHQEKEFSLLLVGKEKVFEHRSADSVTHGSAFLDGECGGVFEGFVFYAEIVEKVIDLHFGFGAVLAERPSFIEGAIIFKVNHGFTQITFSKTSAKLTIIFVIVMLSYYFHFYRYQSTKSNYNSVI